ncbi:MAG: phospholipid carrier-dependent glycosyltransferase [Novosphingobium sp.]|uniref:phospholipid carrier-dependent glycosyltransferase n=1 Tax=Novosphingobium sp. TaxID=1874826 RepID=UPI001DA7532D|nr:phospholipid carrier-dependent glycosyltransferase [Novosphingobium sp.]MCB2058727.1 phospholipid carrier-dependent glycosyltransferase [Novosphingobium sp.]MCP5385420.1 phospholipid carrier-dependent glycosyltransferase [Novosphingobium sp.]
MQPRFTPQQDPADWCATIAVSFLALAWWRLGIPSQIYFDELHYVNAARMLLDGVRANPEHPMLGKEAIAAAMRLLGDQPLYWRVPSALSGALGLFAFSRLVWFASGRRAATIAATFLLATNFMWFVQSRIAMLDMVMAGLGMVGLWQFAAAIRLPHQGRWRLALAGLALGLALGTKWSIAPAAMLPGLLFLALKLRDNGFRFLTTRGGRPVPGISLIEAALWLGLVPLAVYWLTFWPAFYYATGAVDPFDPLGWHRYMLQLQDSVKKLHPYRSVWYEWIGNVRAIWYLYKEVDGVQRGILMIGNPFTMLAGLPALVWAAWAGIMRRRRDALALLVLYAVSLGMWAVSGKPIQFYYHYLLPGAFLMGMLALALEELWHTRGRWRWLAPATLIASAALFAWFYPILSAAPLHNGRASFEHWMWLASWR